jgi:serine/threonine protein kinase
MALTVQDVYGLLLQSQLLPPADARALYERWQQQAPASSSAEFTRWLVAQGSVTEYQAKLLRKGYADGYFLAGYKILERLGRGRMAGVYKAVHDLGQVVAIKVLPPSRARDPHLVARFLREARLAIRLQHPNIVRAFQSGETGGLYYLVMEYLDGETLDDVLQRRGKLPPNEAVRLVYQAILGLQHIHEQGLVHRDLKPANLMLVPRPGDTTLACTVKVLDLGLGRALCDETNAERAVDQGLTTAGSLLGTPDYMSPEQARDARSVDIRSDLYSLGAVLFHLLTGEPVFPDSNVISQMIRHTTEEPRPLRQFTPGLPDALQQLVNSLLAKDPAQRFPTPARAAEAFRAFLMSGAEALPSPESSAPMRAYLAWLEEEGKQQAKAGPAPEPSPYELLAALPDEATPAARETGATLPPDSLGRETLSAVSSAKPAPEPSSKRLSRKSQPRPHEAVTAAMPAHMAKRGFDVEPASGSRSAQRKEEPLPSFLLTWRDLLMFGSGVVGTLLMILLARGLAALFH